jgi:tetrathionate reductase subunit B
MDEREDTVPAESSRREFLRNTCGTASAIALTGVAGGLAADLACQQPQGAGATKPESALYPHDNYEPEKHRYAYLIDIKKCIGCGSCVRACERENDVPEHYFRTWVERYTVGRDGKVEVDCHNGAHDGFDPIVSGLDVTKSFFVPKICNHCTQTPCVQLCPVGASYRTPDGLILVDEKRCIGCGYCVQACPYGSRFIHPKTHVASKCTFCYHRTSKGMMPACVQACPVGARKFGDVKNPKDEVANVIATQMVRVLKPELLTEPNCYYLNLGEEVV